MILTLTLPRAFVGPIVGGVLVEISDFPTSSVVSHQPKSNYSQDTVPPFFPTYV